MILGWKRQQKQPRPDIEVQPNIEVRFQKSRCAPYIRLLLYLPLTLRCLWRLHINWPPAWHMQRIIIHNNERHITYTYCKYSSNALLNWWRRFDFRVYWIIFSAPPPLGLWKVTKRHRLWLWEFYAGSLNDTDNISCNIFCECQTKNIESVTKIIHMCSTLDWSCVGFSLGCFLHTEGLLHIKEMRSVQRAALCGFGQLLHRRR